ncbi:MAG TPA: pyridoxamine 5'-phosphate oxidase [Micromonosporaceae bacterium]|jgi:pyridoxamine 5'-phosphate oxidase
MRREYPDRPPGGGLTEDGLAGTWLEQFRRWFAEAAAAATIVEPNAMVVATATSAGEPSARTVLLKGVDERGFVFFTNYGSRKATELRANPRASLVFGWYPIGRQVIVGGTVERVDRAETESYFASRPREAQLGAWASPQSRPVTREQLDTALAEERRRYPEGTPVPAPPHWGGLLVRPLTVEFWQGRPGRLHDRLRFRWDRDVWIVERLAP